MLNTDPIAALPTLATAKREIPLFRFAYLPESVCIVAANFHASCLLALIGEGDGEPIIMTYEATALFLGEISREVN